MSVKILAAIAAAIVILGGGTYVAVRHQQSLSEERMESKSDESSEFKESGSMSLKALLAEAKPVTCTFSDSSAETSGTVYVANGKMRGDFSSTSNGQPVQSHMIMADNTSYVWTSESNQGMKMMMNSATTATVDSSKSLDPEKKLEYRCSPWVTTSASFDLPKTVTFTEINAGAMMTPPSTSGSANVDIEVKSNGDIEAPQCAACNSVPSGTARDQCKQSLGCK